MNLLGLILCLAVQDKPKVDQGRVDVAIRRGVEYLRPQVGSLGIAHGDAACRYDELVLWTFVHAGVPESDPEFQALFRKMKESALERTYNVSLQAMIQEEMDRVKHQPRIAQCAQFLVDNIRQNGQWSYGEPTMFADEVPTAGTPARAEVATGVRSFAPREKPKVLRKIPVKQKRAPIDKGGDNSNSQYAALGLRACHEAGIVLPREVVQSAQKWWRGSMYDASGGWCYKGEDHGHEAYGSMTAGAVGSLVICDYILGEDWKKDGIVRQGLDWMAKNFTVTGNPGKPEHGGGTPDYMHYYYLYALERTGILCATEQVGTHEWYPEGAEHLLGEQKKDGSWDTKVRDTCFAILFLRRATRPLPGVASTDRNKLR